MSAPTSPQLSPRPEAEDSETDRDPEAVSAPADPADPADPGDRDPEDRARVAAEVLEARRAAALAARAEAEAARDARDKAHAEAEAARSAELEAAPDPGTEVDVDPETLAAGSAAALEARRAAATAARAEAEAAREEREKARAEVEAAREQARAEAEAAKAAREKAVEAAPPPVPMARPRGRHGAVIASFLVMVLLPGLLTGWYLWERAVDQYASYVGFSVRNEEQGSSIDFLGVVSDISTSSSSDTDILYEYLQSQELVAEIDAELDLRAIWSRADPEADPMFAYRPPGTIEDLVGHWGRMVKLYYDSNTGLIDLRVLAFDPEEAQGIAQLIFDKAVRRINELSAVAREDAISYARAELEQAQEQLKQARIAIQAFRNRTQIIDPTIQTETQSGLIGALETQLAEAQIELELLKETARTNDPRITQAELKIEVIMRQIAAERAKLGIEDESSGNSVADLVGEYEALVVDLEFAQQSYTAARAAFDAARNEARRQSRYLAAHVTPTKAEKSEYPDRQALMALTALFLFLFWAFAVLVAYALRDRR